MLRGSPRLRADGPDSPLALHERRGKGFDKAHRGVAAGGVAGGCCISSAAAMGAAGASYLVDLESDQQIKFNKKADPSRTAR